jgi:hypothetical protein
MDFVDPRLFREKRFTYAAWDAEIFRLSSVGCNGLIKSESKMQQAVLLILAGELMVTRQALSGLSLWSED